MSCFFHYKIVCKSRHWLARQVTPSSIFYCLGHRLKGINIVEVGWMYILPPDKKCLGIYVWNDFWHILECQSVFAFISPQHHCLALTKHSEVSHQTYSSILHTHSQHNNSADMLLPDQPPEIIHCFLQWSLASNELLWGIVTLEKKDRKKN